jgi:hypothetical protein
VLVRHRDLLDVLESATREFLVLWICRRSVLGDGDPEFGRLNWRLAVENADWRTRSRTSRSAQWVTQGGSLCHS